MKVFLSSTYLDLIEHRKVVVNALRMMGEEVDHMEIFGARDEEPTKASLDELDKCDVLVGIYAYRYGTVPKGSKVSVTEQEYLHATSKKIPILVFVVNEDYDWSPKKMDESLTKIKKFKAKATAEHMPEYFTSPDNLASKVVSSVGRLAKKIDSKSILYSRASILGTDIPNPTPPKIYGSTLPSQPYFFGRESELAAIAEAISPESRTWGALIYGPGGIGKTALAIEAAHRAPSDLFEIKIFISAKERELTSKGEVSAKEFSHNNFFSILNELALQLGEEGIPRLAPEERANALKHVLTTKKTLLILDNLETLNNDDRDHIYQFLTRLPQGNKAIVTSRRRDDTYAQTIQLDQLQEPEAKKLISELAKRNPRLHDISDTDKKELFYSASGNPLVIRWIIGQVGWDESNIKTIAEAIKFMRQAPQGNDALEYVFGDLLNSLIPSEKIVLAAMVFLSLSPKAAWIAKVTGYGEATIEMIWEELVNRSILVTVKGSKDYLLPHLTRQFVKNKLSKEVAQVEEKLADYAFRIALEFGGRKNIKEQTKLAENWPVISAALPFFLKHDNNNLQIICDALDMFLRSTGLWDEWLWLNQQAEIVALIHDDYDSAGERAYKVGLIYSYLGKPNDVLQYATRAEKHWQEVRTARLSIKGKTRVNHLRGISYKLSGNYPRAMEIINNALDIWKKADPEGTDVAAALNTLGEIQFKEGEMTNTKEKILEAEENFLEATRIALKNNHKEEASIYMGNLANIALRQGDWSRLESIAKHALELAEEYGQQDEIGRENLHLAIAYLNLGHKGPDGLDASRKAVEIYRRLGHKNLPEAEAILNEWEK
jgi:tetratricopeptide (TPR) repeat protein